MIPCRQARCLGFFPPWFPAAWTLSTECELHCSYPNTHSLRPPKRPVPLREPGQHSALWGLAPSLPPSLVNGRSGARRARPHAPGQQPCQAATETVDWKPLCPQSSALLRQTCLQASFISLPHAEREGLKQGTPDRAPHPACISHPRTSSAPAGRPPATKSQPVCFHFLPLPPCRARDPPFSLLASPSKLEVI